MGASSESFEQLDLFSGIEVCEVAVGVEHLKGDQAAIRKCGLALATLFNYHQQRFYEQGREKQVG